MLCVNSELTVFLCLGLAFSKIAESNTNTFFENLVKENQLASNVFSFALARGSSEVDSAGSEEVPGGTLIFGGYDSSLFSGEVVYQDVTVKGYWETDLHGIGVAGEVVSGTSTSVGQSASMPSMRYVMLTSHFCRTAWDTGTTLAYFPTKMLDTLMETLGGQQDDSLSGGSSGNYYTVPCSSLEQGLNVSISFGGTLFSWSDEDLDGGYADGDKENCVLNLIGSDVGLFFITPQRDGLDANRILRRLTMHGATNLPSSVIPS